MPERRLALGACLCALVAGSLGLAAPRSLAATAATAPAGSKPLVSATLAQCVTDVAEAERSVTFAGEMASIPGAARMEMRVDVLERTPRESLFHAVVAPGLGVWRTAAPGVKVYRYLKQVTNLSSPAFYRGAVSFRWLGARGHLIRAEELRTPACDEPEAAPAEPASGTVPPAPAASLVTGTLE